MARCGSPLVVITASDDDQVIIIDRVDETMLVVDAARPVAGEIGSESFRLTGPFERSSEALIDQCVDAFEQSRSCS